MVRSRFLVTLGSAALVAALHGCDDGGTEAGRLALAYSTAEGEVTVATPLAVGSRGTLVLDPRPGFDFGSIVEATSNAPDVIMVARVHPHFVELAALRAGTARIDLRVSTGDDPDLRDSVAVEAREVERASAAHACALEGEGPYLAGGTRVSLPLELSLDDGFPLTGWGYYPFTVEPGVLLRIDDEPRATSRLPLITGQGRGVARVTSDFGGDALELEIAAEADIDGVVLEGGTGGSAIAGGSVGTVRIVPTVRGVPVCQGEPDRELEVATPDVCRVVEPTPQAPARAEVDPSSVVRVEGFDRGVCRIFVRYSNASGGEGLEQPVEIDVL